MENILMVCGIGMVSLFVGVILWGVVDSFLTPDVTIEKPVISNIIGSAEGKAYEIVFGVENDEKRTVKAQFQIKLGFDIYRKRHSSSPKPNFYRVFQAIAQKEESLVVKPRTAQEFTSLIDVGIDVNQKNEIKPETEMTPKVVVAKTEWVN